MENAQEVAAIKGFARVLARQLETPDLRKQLERALADSRPILAAIYAVALKYKLGHRVRALGYQNKRGF